MKDKKKKAKDVLSFSKCKHKQIIYVYVYCINGFRIYVDIMTGENLAC